MFAGLLLQYGAVNCERVYERVIFNANACRLCNLRQVVVSHVLKFNLLDTSTSLQFHFVFKTLVVCLMFLSFSRAKFNRI